MPKKSVATAPKTAPENEQIVSVPDIAPSVGTSALLAQSIRRQHEGHK